MNSKENFLRSLIRDVPDFPRKGIIFKDITPLLASKEGFRVAIEEMTGFWAGRGISKVVSVESRGFIFGAGIAFLLNAGFVPARKPGKLPFERKSITYDLEYGTDTIEVHADAFSKNDRVLVVDDLLATGGTACAAAILAEQSGAVIEGAQFLIELEFLKGREKLLKKIPVVKSIIVF